MTRRLIILFNVLIMIPAAMYSQPVITGRVLDEQGDPLPGANIFIRGTFHGTSSDSSGVFQFRAAIDTGQVLVSRFIGYTEQLIPIGPVSDTLHVEIMMEPAAREIDMVTITAGLFETGADARKTVLRELDIFTTAGTTGDITAALNSLPGTQTVGEEGKLFIRGGDGHETKTFIDGMRVVGPYFTTAPLTPTRNRFSPWMFKGTSFSTGGYSAEYGQGLSSALILSTKEKADQTRTDLTFVPFGAEIAQCIAAERTSLAGKFGYFNMQPYYALVPQNLDWFKAPESIDANLVFRHRTGKSGMIKAYGNLSQSRSGLYRADIDDPGQLTAFSLKNHYSYLNTSYKNTIGRKWMYFIGASGSMMRDNLAFSPAEIRERTGGGQLKMAFRGDLHEQIALNTGTDLFIRDHRWSYTDTLGGGDVYQGIVNQGFREEILTWFLESDVRLSADFLFRIGIRSEYLLPAGPVRLDPRFSLTCRIGAHSTAGLAAGRFRQSPADDLLRIAPELRQEEALHYILNYQYIHDGRTFRAEAYYKDYNRLVRFDPFRPYDPAGFRNTGDGYARGFDVFWRDTYRSFRHVDYWISYSFLDTRREYLDFSEMAVPVFASRHNLSMAYKQFFPGLRSLLSATYTFASPRPYHDPNSGGRNTGRTPAYHDLSATIAWMAAPRVGIFAMCSNILGLEQIFGYEYSTERSADGIWHRRAIVPPARRMIMAGVTITLSRDSVMNQLRTL